MYTLCTDTFYVLYSCMYVLVSSCEMIHELVDCLRNCSHIFMNTIVRNIFLILLDKLGKWVHGQTGVYIYLKCYRYVLNVAAYLETRIGNWRIFINNILKFRRIFLQNSADCNFITCYVIWGQNKRWANHKSYNKYKTIDYIELPWRLAWRE